MRHWIAVSVFASFVVPATAHAALTPGVYTLAGFQEICLQADKTWYGTIFPGWGGAWRSGATGSSIYGNYAEGDGNDSIVLGPDNMGIWQEWRDDLSWQILSRNISLTYTGDTCPPPAAVGLGKANPATR